MNETTHHSRETSELPGPADDGTPGGPTAYPGLYGLRLTAEDLEVLKHQGTVQPERRGNRRRHKLRFRRGGKQVVRCIGGEQKANQIREELARWQALHRKTRRLARLAKKARRVLRESKRFLEPHLAKHGYRYYGLEIRRIRN